MVLADGGEAYAALGTGRSRGTQVFQLAGNVARGGIVEADFGITLRELVEDFGGGTRSGRPVKAVQVGGPLGAYLAGEQFDLPMDYEAFAEAGRWSATAASSCSTTPSTRPAMARFAMEFCAKESCGKCTPCRDRVGARRRGHRPDPVAHRRRRQPHPAHPPRRPLHDDDQGLAVRDGRPHPDAGAQRPRGTSPRTSASRPRHHARSRVHDGHRRASPSRPPTTAHPRSGGTDAHVTIDGIAVMVPPGTSVMRAAKIAGIDVPKLCATDSLEGLRLLPPVPRRGRGHAWHPASCTTPCTDGMVVRPAPSRSSSCVAVSWSSTSPTTRTDCAGCERGNCEMQGWPCTTSVSPRCATASAAPRTSTRPSTVQPVLRLRPEGLHRLLALCARLRRDPGHLRPHRRRAGASTRGSPPAAPTSCPPSASPAAPASRRARPTRSPRSRSSSSGCPPAPWSPRAPTAGSAAPSRPRCRAAATTPGSCGWCRGRTAAPTRATRASRAASPTGTPRTATASSIPWSATRSTTSGRS
jgi:hypothetical protein